MPHRVICAKGHLGADQAALHLAAILIWARR